MPNNCYGSLEVKGAERTLKRFLKKAKVGKKIFSSNGFVPYPDEYAIPDKENQKWNNKADIVAKENGFKHQYEMFFQIPESKEEFINIYGNEPADGFNAGGYGWCARNWGSKWDFCDVDIINEGPNEVTINFWTAWSPQEPVVSAMAEQFKTLDFSYDYQESGMCFQGKLYYEHGECVLQECEDYDGYEEGEDD